MAILREVLRKSGGGADVSNYYAKDAEYVADPRNSAELQASLGSSRADLPLTLLDRQVKDGISTSIFRSGDNGATRLVTVRTDSSGKLHSLAVEPDPDNR
ncbi:MAG TPA: hypothetical protein VGN77_03275 [Steroidobacteraceae bacterium]|nr:hypothetical protein [Steroidobacteraceae bacterium]